MRDDDHVGLDQGQHFDAFVDVREHRLVACRLTVGGADRAARHHALEMHRDAPRCQLDHLGFDRRVAWRDQKAEPRAPADHGLPPFTAAGA
jgi:hypothetical protein